MTYSSSGLFFGFGAEHRKQALLLAKTLVPHSVQVQSAILGSLSVLGLVRKSTSLVNSTRLGSWRGGWQPSRNSTTCTCPASSAVLRAVCPLTLYISPLAPSRTSACTSSVASTTSPLRNEPGNANMTTGRAAKHGGACSQALTKVAVFGRCVQGGIFVFVHGVQLRPEPHQLLDDCDMTTVGSEMQCRPAPRAGSASASQQRRHTSLGPAVQTGDTVPARPFRRLKRRVDLCALLHNSLEQLGSPLSRRLPQLQIQVSAVRTRSRGCLHATSSGSSVTLSACARARSIYRYGPVHGCRTWGTPTEGVRPK